MKKEIAKNQKKPKEITLGEVAKKLDNYATKTDKQIANLASKTDRLVDLIDGLAVAMANGFKRAEERMDNFDIRFDKLEDHVSFKIDGLQSSIDTLSTTKTNRSETKLLEVRVAKLEHKKI